MACIEEAPEGYYIHVGNHKKIFAQVAGEGKQAIVLVHGWGLNHNMWKDYVPTLKDDYKVVAIDLRGFGKSSKPLTGYSYKTWADDISKVIECLELEHVTLAGYSLGGAIAMYYVSKGVKPAVERLALIAAAGPCMTKLRGRLEDESRKFLETQIKILEQDMRRGKKVDRREQVFQQFYQVPHINDKDWKWLTDMLWSASLQALLWAIKEMAKWDLTDALEQIAIGNQTRICHGLKDSLVPFTKAQEQHRRIKGSTLIPFENGHLLFYCEQEKLCNNLSGSQANLRRNF